MGKLKTEIKTPEMGERVRAAFFAVYGHDHDVLSDFEHGQWWVTCISCGAQWAANDAWGQDTADGFGFERVSDGDESCHGPESESQ